MKLRSITCLTALFAISLNALAFQITKGKLISERDFTTGVVKSTKFIDTESTKVNIAPRFNQLKYSHYLNSIDSFVGMKVLNNQPIQMASSNNPLMIMTANNNLSLQNNETIAKLFQITTQLCAIPSDTSTDINTNYQCSIRQTVVELDAGGMLNGNLYQKVEMNLTPGEYTQFSGVYVQKEGDKTNYSTYDSTAFVVTQEPTNS